mgnify:CR=1 FL=1
MNNTKTRLTGAEKLRSRYAHLTVFTTKNPVPMHQLVMESIPALLDPNQVVSVEGKFVGEYQGKTITQQMVRPIAMDEIYGEGYVEKSAISIQKLVDIIQSKGYHANMGGVAAALSQLKSAGLVQSRKVNNDGSVPNNQLASVYFRTKQVLA